MFNLCSIKNEMHLKMWCEKNLKNDNKEKFVNEAKIVGEQFYKHKHVMQINVISSKNNSTSTCNVMVWWECCDAFRWCFSNSEVSSPEPTHRGPETQRKRKRTIFSRAQLSQLEQVFAMTPYPDITLRERLAAHTHLPENKIQVNKKTHFNHFMKIVDKSFNQEKCKCAQK